MKAAIFRGGDIVVDSLPEPVPARGQVLVRTLACGICGSDLHAAKHAHRMVAVTRPAVMAAAVVAQPDAKWGEVPCAFVELKEGASVSREELLTFCRQHLAGFKLPKNLVFGTIPKTSTGKVQKFVLRAQVRATAAIDV